MKPQIILKPLHHRDGEKIGLYYKHSPGLNVQLRNNADAKWSQTNKCWYIPMTQSAIEKLKATLNDEVLFEATELRKYFEEIKKNKVSSQPSIKNDLPERLIKSPDNKLKTTAFISPINRHVLPAMEQHLKLKAYSTSTIRTYLNEMAQLLQLIGDIPADELTVAHLKRYLVYCYEKLQLKENTLHSRINAMKFYYEQVRKLEKFFWEIPRPKKQLILPKLLNEKEVSKLFNALDNKKHKAILFTAYSAGLRVSEIVNLKMKDIDSVRMQILIQRAKGKKDRYVNLSPVLVDILRSYYKTYTPKPKLYLFESEYTGTAYPIRTVQQIFSNAKKKAGISKCLVLK